MHQTRQRCTRKRVAPGTYATENKARRTDEERRTTRHGRLLYRTPITYKPHPKTPIIRYQTPNLPEILGLLSAPPHVVVVGATSDV